MKQTTRAHVMMTRYQFTDQMSMLDGKHARTLTSRVRCERNAAAAGHHRLQASTAACACVPRPSRLKGCKVRGLNLIISECQFYYVLSAKFQASASGPSLLWRTVVSVGSYSCVVLIIINREGVVWCVGEKIDLG